MAQGNVSERSGGDSTIWWGREDTDSPIKSSPVTSKPTAGARKGKIMQVRLPFTDLGFDLASEQTTSRSIIGGDAATKRTRGQIWSEGSIGTELLPNTISHWMRPIYNALDDAHDTVVAPNVNNFNPSATAETALSAGNTAAFTKGSGDAAHKLLPPSDFDLQIPARLKLPNSMAANLKVGDKVSVVGRRRIGLESSATRDMTEVITCSTAGQLPQSKKFFWEIDEIVFPEDTNKAPVAGSITFDTEIFKTEFLGFNKILFRGATVLMSKGGVPYIAEKVLWNTMNMVIGDGIEAEFGLIGGKIEDYKFIDSSGNKIGSHYSIPEEWLSDTAYPLPALDFEPAWGGVLYIGAEGFDGSSFDGAEDNIIEFSNLIVNVNLNLESKRGYRGSPYRNRPKKSGTSRECIITPTVYLESGDVADYQNNRFKKWNDHYLDGGSVPITLKTYNWLDNGKQYWQEWRVLTSQLVEVPSFSIDDPSTIERDLAFLCLPKTTTPSNELVFINYADQYGE